MKQIIGHSRFSTHILDKYFPLKKSVVAMSGLLLSTVVSVDVAAQDELRPEDKKNQQVTLEEIVVTGTLIRGAAPAGSNVIGLTEEEVAATGAISAAQLLQTVPQMGSFNDLQSPTFAFNNVTTNRPNLRNLPGFNTAGSSTTLVLMDGHRIVGMGVQSTSPDPDIIPPSVMQRVEIVPDGGSAIYGSDAVAGVINFITRDEFDGVEVELRSGFGDSYDTLDGSITAGRSWGSGSAYIAYNHAQNDEIKGSDRDYVFFPEDNVAGLPRPVRDIRCNPGNVQVLGFSVVAALPYSSAATAVPGTVNDCDITGDYSIYPEQERDSLLVGLSQTINDKLDIDVRGFRMERDSEGQIGTYNSTVFLPASQVFGGQYALFGGTPFAAFEFHQVDFDFGEVRRQDLSLETWGVAPSLTYDIGGGWQLRALASYGESETENYTPAPSSTAVNTAIFTGFLNPYEISLSDPAVVQALQTTGTFGRAEQELFDTSLIVDGGLFSIPGGEVKLAFGVEYTDEEYRSQTASDVLKGTENTGYEGFSVFGGAVELIAGYDPIPIAKLDRQVKSAFGELVIPIFGADNGRSGVEELTLSISGRYDDYSDFGDTFNPKFGLTWKPVEWLSIRGAWGESFVAPSLADDETTQLTSATYISGIGFLLPPDDLVTDGTYPAPQPGQQTVVVLGNAPDIQPQEAETTSIGFDISPPAVPGLDLGMTWWKIDFTGVIGIPNFTNRDLFWRSFGNYLTVTPTQQEIDAVNAAVDTFATPLCSPLPTCVYAVMDARKDNLGDLKVDGLDFSANYVRDLSFGSMYFGFNGNYELNREQSPVAGAPFRDILDKDVSKFRAKATVGAQIDRLRAEVTLLHRAGYDLSAPVGLNDVQDDVDAFNVVNLFFKYDFTGQDLLEDLSLTLFVENIFDEDPPEYLAQNQFTPNVNGYTNGNTVGRLVQLGVRKKF